MGFSLFGRMGFSVRTTDSSRCGRSILAAATAECKKFVDRLNEKYG
jgi:hypothetical protein